MTKRQLALQVQDQRYAAYRRSELATTVAERERAIVDSVLSEAFMSDTNSENAMHCEQLRMRVESARQALAEASK